MTLLPDREIAIVETWLADHPKIEIVSRFNVVTSRAKCLSILVASPDVFEAGCKTLRQIQLANAFCRYLEMCSVIQLPALRNAAKTAVRPTARLVCIP